jgi:hypothetical protein
MATSDFQKLFYDDTSGLQDNDIISTGTMSIFIEAVLKQLFLLHIPGTKK